MFRRSRMRTAGPRIWAVNVTGPFRRGPTHISTAAPCCARWARCSAAARASMSWPGRAATGMTGMGSPRPPATRPGATTPFSPSIAGLKTGRVSRMRPGADRAARSASSRCRTPIQSERRWSRRRPRLASRPLCAMMEADAGVALTNVRIRDGKRLSVFRTYVYPWIDRSNLTVLTGTLVTKVLFDGKRVTGVEVVRDGKLEQFQAGCEVVLSLGAIQTPKILMQSGIGDTGQLRSFDIGVVQHLPGVGANLQEHVLLAGCVWEHAEPDQFQSFCGEATFFAKSDPALATPDLQAFVVNGPFLSAELSAHTPAGSAWSMTPGLVRPQSRGQIRLTGAKPTDPVDIDLNILSQRVDLRAAMECVRLCREMGNGAAFRSLTKREACPGPVGDVELEAFVRNAAVPFWHHTCTAKLGRDDLSVVDGNLPVYVIDGLRVAAGSIMPTGTPGTPMAPR